MKYKPKLRTLPTKYTKGFIATLDRRQVFVRELQATFDRLVDDQGGAEDLSIVRLSLLERFVFLLMQIREWEKEMLAGGMKGENYARWLQALNSLTGLSKTIGLDRKDIPAMDLKAYLEEPK